MIETSTLPNNNLIEEIFKKLNLILYEDIYWDLVSINETLHLILVVYEISISIQIKNESFSQNYLEKPENILRKLAVIENAINMLAEIIEKYDDKTALIIRKNCYVHLFYINSSYASVSISYYYFIKCREILNFNGKYNSDLNIYNFIVSSHNLSNKYQKHFYESQAVSTMQTAKSIKAEINIFEQILFCERSAQSFLRKIFPNAKPIKLEFSPDIGSAMLSELSNDIDKNIDNLLKMLTNLNKQYQDLLAVKDAEEERVDNKPKSRHAACDSIVMAYSNKHTSCFFNAISTNKSAVNKKDGVGKTVLHHAAFDGNLKWIKMAVKNGANINVTNDKKQTPLHLAVINAHGPCVKYLLDHGASSNILNKKGKKPIDYVGLLEPVVEKKISAFFDNRIHIELSETIIKIINLIHSANKKILLVGGAVRDSVLGVKPNDYDFITTASIQEMYGIFKEEHGWIIEVSWIDSIVLKKGAEKIDITSVKLEPGQSIENSLRENSFTRDFTINALYWDPIKRLIFDYNCGLIDIKNKLIRSIVEPDLSFNKDPCRILRAIRFSLALNFEIESHTKDKIIAEIIIKTNPRFITKELIKLEAFEKERIDGIFKELNLLDFIQQVSMKVKNSSTIFTV